MCCAWRCVASHRLRRARAAATCADPWLLVRVRQYEAYQPMAEREMLAICLRMRERWPLRHVAITHRIGVVPIGEASVEIAVSSAHRREALEAVQFAIDDLKAHVPIWKKEVYEGDATAWKENAESRAGRGAMERCPPAPTDA